MVRIVHVTDTHVGNDGTGWGHHPIRPDLVPMLFDALGQWMKKQPVDLLIHTGDAIDRGTKEQRHIMRVLFGKLPTRTALALGNHDVASPDADTGWIADVPEIFPLGKNDLRLESGPVDVIVLANAWLDESNSPRLFWPYGEANEAALSEDQWRWLEEELRRSERPVVVCVHSQLDPLPPGLTGLDRPIHEPEPRFAVRINALLDRFPLVRLVLSGHCHATCATRHGDRVNLTTAAFCEPPFEARIIEIDNSSIFVRTFSPLETLPSDVAFNEDVAWTTGRPDDRVLSVRL